MKNLPIGLLTLAVVCLSLVDTAEAQLLRRGGRGDGGGRGLGALLAGGDTTRATAIVNPPGFGNRTVARSSVRGGGGGVGGFAIASAGVPVANFNSFAVAAVPVHQQRVFVAPVAVAAVAVPVCATTFVPRVHVQPVAIATVNPLCATTVVSPRFNAFGTVTSLNTCGQVFESDVFGNSAFVGNRFGSAGIIHQPTQLPAGFSSRIETRTVFGQ